MEHTHDHSHHTHEVTHLSKSRIQGVAFLNALITLAEISGGLASGSLSLLSDALHNLSDTLSIVLSYVTHQWAQKPKNKHKTFGYKRAEILSAFINGITLIVISSFLMVEAVQRFLNPQPIETSLMLWVAIIGLFANLFSVLLLQRDSHHNLNIKSSYLHLIADTLSSVAVILGGLLMRYAGAYWLDPLLTLGIALYIIKEAFSLLKLTIDILMQASPDLDYDDIKAHIERIPYVKNIHHIHAWRMDEKNIYFEAHIDFEDLNLSTLQTSLHEIEHLLKDEFGIHHVTLQAECDVCTTKEMF